MLEIDLIPSISLFFVIMIYSNIFSKPGRIIYAVIKGSHSLRDETEKIFLSGQTHK